MALIKLQNHLKLKGPNTRGMNVSEKIISSHLKEGKMVKNSEIGIKIDQTLTQDATGTMAYLFLEAMGIKRIKTMSVSYIDHNTLQLDFMNPDDHIFLQTAAAKFGAILSKAGNGICHQVHLESFGAPGATLLGSDSHTPTIGGLGALGIGAGGLDCALAMAGKPYYLKMPEIVGIELKGNFQKWVSAKDVILEILRALTVNGGVEKMFEYFGEAIVNLSIPERATITNMGAELGATSSIFPSDISCHCFLSSMGRGKVYKEIKADTNSGYDAVYQINLDELEPLIALPHSPDNVKKVKQVQGQKIDQVVIGSCTNSSYRDMLTVAKVLKNRKTHPDVELIILPGSRKTLQALERAGAIRDMIEAGARIFEPTCGPCIGMGGAPCSKGVSLRTTNRNFKARSGTKDAEIFLASPETAVVSAIAGKITDPREFDDVPKISKLTRFHFSFNSLIINPLKNKQGIKIIKGPNIATLPRKGSLPSCLSGKVLIKVGDNITTDDIMPAGKYLPLRSNVPKYAEHVFESIDALFSQRALKEKGGFILGGRNYGQGSSREHAALCPMYLGVKAVLAISFARIHKANLINFGIIPIEISEQDYKKLKQEDFLEIPAIKKTLEKEQKEIIIKTDKTKITGNFELNKRDIKILLAGGSLNLI